MTTITQPGTLAGSTAGILDRERIIAAAGFNRWLVPPAALCIHLCIGMAYGFSLDETLPWEARASQRYATAEAEARKRRQGLWKEWLGEK